MQTNDQLLGMVAACPASWVRLDRTAVLTIEGNEYYCYDTFGDERNRRPVYINGEWYIRVDLAIHHPREYGVRIVGNWALSWE